MTDDHVRIRYDKGETGWAKALGNGRFMIANIPLANDLNIDDVVTLEDGNDGFLKVTDVLERRYPYKTVIKYEETSQYREICDKALEAGCKAEGLVGPSAGKPGICVVAHDDNINLKQIVEEIGIKTPQYTEEEMTAEVE